MGNTAVEGRKIAQRIGKSVEDINEDGVYAYLNGKSDHDGHSCFLIKKNGKVRTVELMLLSPGDQKDFRKGCFNLPTPKSDDPDFAIHDYKDDEHFFRKLQGDKLSHVAQKGNLVKLDLDEDMLNQSISKENEMIMSTNLGYEEYTCNTYTKNILKSIENELSARNEAQHDQEFFENIKKIKEKETSSGSGNDFSNSLVALNTYSNKVGLNEDKKFASKKLVRNIARDTVKFMESSSNSVASKSIEFTKCIDNHAKEASVLKQSTTIGRKALNFLWTTIASPLALIKKLTTNSWCFRSDGGSKLKSLNQQKRKFEPIFLKMQSEASAHEKPQNKECSF